MHHGGDDDPRTTGESGVARSHLDEPDAAQRLGIDPASLETYVSYGWVRRYVTTDGRYLYDRSDIDRVLSHAARHAATPADGMALGEVAEEIGITTLDPFGPIYRGYRAIELIDQGIPFEGVAELLWAGSTPRAAWWPMTADIPRALQGRVGEGLTESALFRLVLTELAIADRHPNAMHAKDDLERARILLPALAGSMALMDPRIELKAVLRTRRVAERAALALGADRVAELLVNRALVLTADHEVAASTFAARVAA
ncbi:MAG: hypothetical protein KC620_21190, partial [Myxococcales bacterium]|nr:hypothetical protein [Myxococcales bacterium]